MHLAAPLNIVFFFCLYSFIYFWLPTVALARAFSRCCRRGLLFAVVRGLLTVVACLAAERGPRGSRASVVAACGIFLDQGSHPCALHIGRQIFIHCAAREVLNILLLAPLKLLTQPAFPKGFFFLSFCIYILILCWYLNIYCSCVLYLSLQEVLAVVQNWISMSGFYAKDFVFGGKTCLHN